MEVRPAIYISGDCKRQMCSAAEGLREMSSELVLRSALEGDLEVVSRLVSSQYVHVDVAERRGNTALHCAAVSHSVFVMPSSHLDADATYLLSRVGVVVGVNWPLNHSQLALELFSQLSAPVVRRKANVGSVVCAISAYSLSIDTALSGVA